jgi:hypothetical protein
VCAPFGIGGTFIARALGLVLDFVLDFALGFEARRVVLAAMMDSPLPGDPLS